MKKQIVFYILCIPTCLIAQVEKGPDLDLRFMLLNHFCQWGIEGNYNISRYVGLGLGIDLQSDFNKSYSGTLPKDRTTFWEATEESEKDRNLVLRPFLRVRTPYLKFKKSSWAVLASPALLIYPLSGDMISIQFNKPIQGNRYLTWTENYSSSYWPIRVYGGIQIGLEYRIKDFAFVGGLEISNQDFYSGRRRIKFEGVEMDDHLPAKTAHAAGIFLGIRYFP